MAFIDSLLAGARDERTDMVIRDNGKASRFQPGAANVRLTLDTTKLDVVLASNDDKEFRRFIQNAINDTLRWAKSRIERVARQTLTARPKDIRGRVLISEFASAKSDTMAGRVTVSGSRIPLGAFSARMLSGWVVRRVRRRPKWRMYQDYDLRVRRGTGYQIERGGERKVLSDVFIPQLPSGHRGVFRRTGKARLPIKQLFGPSLPAFAERNKQLGAKLGIDITEKLNAELDRAVNRWMQKQGF